MIVKTTTKEKKKNLTAKFLFFGKPKIGKTRLATTLDVQDDSEVLFIPVDPGTLSVGDRDFQIWEPPNGGWTYESLDEIYEELIKPENNNIKYVILDGVDDLGQRLLNIAMANNNDGRAAYGELANQGRELIFKFRDIHNKTVIFITHPTTKKENGKDVLCPKFPGGVSEELAGYFDVIAYMDLVTLADGSEKPMLFCKPTSSLTVGDRSGVLDSIEEPNLAKLLKKLQLSGVNVVDDTPRKITKNELNSIPKWVKDNGLTPDKFTKAANELFGDLKFGDYTVVQLNQVKEKALAS